MADAPDNKEGSKPPEGKAPEGDDPEKGKGDDAPGSSYQKLKAAHDQANAELRTTKEQVDKLGGQVAQLEAKLVDKPKDDTERLANLELELARSKAVSRYGLSEEDAERLKGSPEEILADAKYWADRAKEKQDPPKKDPDPTTDKKDGEGQKVDGNGKPPPKAPDPKNSNLSWMQQYQSATPAERDKMDAAVAAGDVDPTK